MGYGGMGYGGGMGYAGGGMMLNRGGQPNAAADPQQQNQFDFRRELQTTIGKGSHNLKRFVGGLNATLGLAFGVAQMANLGSMSISQ